MSFVDFDSLPSNGIIAKIILCDVDLLFEGQKFEMLVSLKQWESALKFNYWGNFCRF